MKFKITKEIQEAYDEYVKVAEVVNESNNYNGRSKERKAKDKAEKTLRNIFQEEAQKQGKELVERLGFNPEELNVRYEYNCGETFSYFTDNGKLNPCLRIDIKPGWYGSVSGLSDEELKVKLQENKENENKKKSELNVEKQTLKAVEGMLQGSKFKSAWDKPWSDKKEGYYNGKVSCYKGGMGKEPYYSMDITPEGDKTSIDAHIRFENISKEKAVEIFATIQKIVKEQESDVE